MCGRIFVKTNLKDMMGNFSFARPLAASGIDNQFPKYNGPPGEYYPIIIREVVRESGQMGPVFDLGRWGFIPHWAKDAARPYVNARSEGVAASGAFKHAYRSRRCLVPIDGFFEWKAIFGQKIKQPYAIAMKSGRPFALAGIYASRRTDAAHEDRNFCILTCAANSLMETIHDRMPVILHPEDYDRWLSDEEHPSDLLKPFPSELMTIWPVDKKAGNFRNNTPDVIEEIEEEEPPLL